MRKLWFLCIFELMMAACKPGIPNGIIPEDDMEDILVDYHLAQGMAEQSDKMIEVDRYKYIHEVFLEHGVTEAQFDSSLVYYCENSEILAQMYERIYERVQAKAQLLGVHTQSTENKYANLTAEGDTANMWSDINFATLQHNKLNNLYQFSIPIDTTYHAGDAFIWHYNTQYITQAMAHEAYAQIAFEYENDSIVTRDMQIRGSMEMEMEFEPMGKLDSVRIRNIRGFVFIPLPERTEEHSFQVLILRQMALIRIHRKPVEKLPADSLVKDSLNIDTATHVSNAPKASGVRLTPTQMRDTQPREQKIHVIKEKAYRPSRQQNGLRRRRRML